MIRTLVHEQVSAPGTGTTLTLAGGPVSSRRSFASAFASGSTVAYFLDDGSKSEWGLGVFTLGAPSTLTRATVLGNSNGTTARLNFSGLTNVYNETPGELATYAGSSWGGTAGGSANALTITVPTALPGTPPDGAEVDFTVNATNTAAVTLAVNGGSALPLRRGDGNDYGPGVLRAGNRVKARRIGSTWITVEPMTGPIELGAVDLAGATWRSIDIPSGFRSLDMEIINAQCGPGTQQSITMQYKIAGAWTVYGTAGQVFDHRLSGTQGGGSAPFFQTLMDTNGMGNFLGFAGNAANSDLSAQVRLLGLAHPQTVRVLISSISAADAPQSWLHINGSGIVSIGSGQRIEAVRVINITPSSPAAFTAGRFAVSGIKA